MGRRKKSDSGGATVIDRATGEELEAGECPLPVDVDRQELRLVYVDMRRMHSRAVARRDEWEGIKDSPVFQELRVHFINRIEDLRTQLETCKKAELEVRQDEIADYKSTQKVLDRTDLHEDVEESRKKLREFEERNALLIADLRNLTDDQLDGAVKGLAHDAGSDDDIDPEAKEEEPAEEVFGCPVPYAKLVEMEKYISRQAIQDGKPIKGIIEADGAKWVCLAVVAQGDLIHSATCIEVSEYEMWQGSTTEDHTRIAKLADEEGLIVKGKKGAKYVLHGQQIVFVDELECTEDPGEPEEPEFEGVEPPDEDDTDQQAFDDEQAAETETDTEEDASE